MLNIFAVYLKNFIELPIMFTIFVQFDVYGSTVNEIIAKSPENDVDT